MKIYAHSNAETIKIDITVEFYGDIILGAKTVPYGKKKLTVAEWEDFTDFLEDVEGLIYTYEFKIMEQHPSNSSESASYYYTFYPTDSDFDVCYENLYFLRISTHERQSEADNPFPSYYPKTAQKYKMPKNKSGTQHHRKMKVIVNDRTYDTYDDAFEALKKKFKNLQIKSDKLNGK